MSSGEAGGDGSAAPASCVLTLTGALTMQIPCVSSGVASTDTDLVEVKSASGTIGAPGVIFDFQCAPEHPASAGTVDSSTCSAVVVDTVADGGNITWQLQEGGSVAGDSLDLTLTSVTPIDNGDEYAIAGHGGFTLVGSDGSTLTGAFTF